MSLIKFLLLDCALLVIGLTLVIALQSNKEESYIDGKLNLKEIEAMNSLNLPRLKELLELEVEARKGGSGIQLDNIIGLWNFVSVWKKNTDKEDSIASALLRLFSASLEIRKKVRDEKEPWVSITNSIRFGSLSIQFIGSGELKGSQPLLFFFFESIELKFSKTILISRSLVIPEENNKPFFALIAKDENCKWLSARGRGGGLALWIKDPSL